MRRTAETDRPYVAWVALRGAPELRDGWIRNPGFLKLHLAMLDRRLDIFGLP